jgi:hypothetical protein
VVEIPRKVANCADRLGILRLRKRLRSASPLAPLRMTGLASILSLMMFGPSALATTYYVSSSTGNDANSGTSSSTAWQTIAHVNGRSFQPGDSILFKRGDVWNESLAPASSGSSGNPITFDAYGSGAAPNLTGYYAVPATAWVLVTGNAWKAPVPATYTTINFCLFGSVWGQKVAALSSNLTAQWDFYLANGYIYVFSMGNPGTYYNEPIVPMALSNVPVINVSGQSWLTFQHFLVNWFDEYGVYVQGTSDHLVFANMEADSMIPQGTQPLGFYVDESAPGPGDIKIYNSEAHLNYDGFRFDGSAIAITMVNDKGYANRDGALVDNTGAVTYSYCHFYASSLAVAGSTDVEWTIGNGPTAGAGNIAADTAPAVEVYQRYPAEVTLTVDDAGMTAGADTYYANTVLPLADAQGVPVGAAITVGYPLAQTLVSEFQGWVNAGRDVTSHSMSHTYYTNTDALEIQYTGSGTAAALSISNKTLTITVTGASDSVTYNLAQGQTQGTIRGLRLALLATGKFTAAEIQTCQGPYGTGCSAYTESALLAQDLADVSGQDVRTAVYHMQLDVTRLTTDEIALSRQWMITNLTGLPATPMYVYPGGYETTTMQGLAAGVPYMGGRGALKQDLGVKDTYADGFNVQNITSFGVNPSWMGLTPAALNQKIQALVWKESVWGVPWGIFWHLNELINDDPVGGTEITNLLQDFKNSGATIRTNTGLVNWLLGGTQETGTDGNYYYKSAATSMALDFRPTKNSPVVDAGQNLGTACQFDISGANQNTYGSGWEIGAHVYQGYAVYGGGTGSYFTVGGTTNCGAQPGPCVQLPINWVNSEEWQGTTAEAINFPSTGTGGNWVCGSTNYGPYTAGSQSSAQQAINDAESCRTATGTGVTITFPRGALYSGSSGLSLPQTTGDTSTTFIVLTSNTPLSTSQTVCSHGVQDNVVESTQPGLRNPFCDGTQMSFQNGTATVTNLYTPTTSTNAISAGTNYLTVASTAGMAAGLRVGVDLGAAHEATTVIATGSGSTCGGPTGAVCFQAAFAYAHPSGITVTVPVGAFTLANGTNANTSDYNDLASMWGIQYTGGTQGLSCGVGGDGSPCHNYAVINAHIFPTPCTYVPGTSPSCTGGNTTQLPQVKIAPYDAGAVTSLGNFATHVHLLGIYLSGDWTDVATASVPFSITNPPPASWYPYKVSGSLFNNPLPSSVRCYGASSNGLTSGNCAAGDIIAKASLTGAGDCYSSTVNNMNCGFLGIGYPGGNGDQNPGYYYCTAATCNWFKVNSTTCPENPVTLNLSFLAPNGAQFSGANGDQSLFVYDQLQGLLVGLATSNHGAGANIGTSSCPGTGPSSCAVAVSPNPGICSAAPINTSGYPDWNNGTTYTWNGYTGVGSVNSAGAVNGALDIRLIELATGVINHAIPISIPCQYPQSSGFPFPSPGTSTYELQFCSTPNANEPLPGMLFQLDYTAAQIAAMNLPTWQAGIITALSTYGGYAKATQSFTMAGSPNGMSVPGTGGEEGPEACYFYNSSWCLTNVFDVLQAQGGKTGACGTSTYANGCFINASSNSTMQFAAFIFQNIPLAIGPEGTDSNGRSCTTGAGCDVTGHMHVLDQCVAKGLAGQPGSCP